MELDKILSQMSDYTTDAIVITKALTEDRNIGPEIVYVNKSFTTLTGYEAAEVIGKTPKILQGARTDKKTLARIAHAVEEKKNPALKKYMDLNRFSAVIKCRLNGEWRIAIDIESEIDLKNLNFKKRVLLELPPIIVKVLIGVQRILGNSVFR